MVQEGITTRRLTITEALGIIGEYGLFQKIINVIIFLSYIPICTQTLIIVFLAEPSQWKCEENNTACPLNETLNAEDNRKCDLMRSYWMFIKPKDFSIITQHDISCEKEWMLIVLTSLYFIGWALGSIVVGYIADNYGRKVLIFPSFLIIMVLGATSPYFNSIYMLMASRFLIGLFIQGTTVQGLILLSEVVGQKQRPFATITVFLACGVGWCLLPLLAYLLQNWKYLSIACTLPYLLLLPSFLFLPESLKWSLVHGDSEQTVKILKRIAYYNKTILPDNVLIVSDGEVNELKDSNKRSSPLDLFTTRSVALTTLRLCYIWTVTVIGFYGVYMAANQLGGSLYRDFALLSIVNFVAVPLPAYLCNKVGRKWCVLLSLLFGSIIAIAAGIVPAEGEYRIYRVVLGIFGALFFTMAYNGLFTWTVELFPTNVRSMGVGFAMVCSQFGSALIPAIVDGLKVYGHWCPFVSLGVPALIGFFVGLELPETRR